MVDSASTDGLMNQLGPKLRALRTERQLTLEAVAERARLTKGFLSLVERGQTTVSVPNLLKLCEILGATVGSLFDYPESAVVRKDQGAPVGMGGSGIREYLLTPEYERNLQVMRTVLQTGGGTGGAYTLDTETIFVFVIRGTLRLAVDGQESLLGAGDSFTFSARAAHSWDNPGREESEILWFIVPPLPNRR